VHVARAGVVAGVFDESWRLPRDYESFEAAFIAWAQAGGVRPAILDTTIWTTLARSDGHRREILGIPCIGGSPRPVWPATSQAAPPLHRRHGNEVATA
jgi:hypothetical protein